MSEFDPLAQARWQGETTQTLKTLVATVDQMAKDQHAANIRREQLDAHILAEIQRVEKESRERDSRLAQQSAARDAELERQQAEWRGNLRGFLVGCTLVGGGVGGSIVAAALRLVS